MTSRDLLKSAVVGIAVAVLVLVIGVAGQVAWVVWRLPGIHEGSGKIPVTSETTVMFDRSVTVSESYTDFRWVSFTPSLTVAAVGLVGGFWWAFRRHPTRTPRTPTGEAP